MTTTVPALADETSAESVNPDQPSRPQPWLSDEALLLPFDQYQRYAGAARVVDALLAAGGYSMLEVGGAPGFPELFFTPAKLAVTDRYGQHSGNYLVADGARLPFPDQSFDIVVTMDTLEHVVPEDRPAFLAECRRVSRDLVILTAPHCTDLVVEAEVALQAFVTARFGEVFATLAEHSERGLPLVADTVAGLGADGWSAVSAPSGYLPRWLSGMVVHHELLAVGLPELPELHAFYNRLMAPYDNQEPAYRRMVVASRRRPAAELEAAIAPLLTSAPPGRTDTVTSAIAGRLLAERVGLGNAEQVRKSRDHDILRGHLREEKAALADTRALLAARDAELQARDQRVADLEHLVSALEADRAELLDRARAASWKRYVPPAVRRQWRRLRGTQP